MLGRVLTQEFMLIGEHEHRIDAKRRLSLPAKMRRVFGGVVILTRGLDRCLFIYAKDEWAGKSRALAVHSEGNADSRQYVRSRLSGAEEVEIDALGRILVPERLTTYAALSTGVTIIGVGNHAEIWDTEKWKAYRDEMESRTDELAERMGGMNTS